MEKKYQLRCGIAAYKGKLSMNTLRKARLAVKVGDEYIEFGSPDETTFGGMIVQVDSDLDPIIAQQIGFQPGSRPDIGRDECEKILRDK